MADGETVALGGIALTVTDLGPGESPHDSIWSAVGEPRTVFSGDVAYDRTHCYLADGFHEGWLAQHRARCARELPAGATLHPGHGEPCGLEVLDWQEGYIATFLEAVAAADWPIATPPTRWSRGCSSTCRRTSCEFLMELSVEPLAAALAA